MQSKYDPFDNAPESVDWNTLRSLREAGPTELVPDLYVLARHLDADHALRNGGGKSPEFSHVNGMRPARTKPDPQEELMSEIDGPHHSDIRKLLMAAMQPRIVAALEPYVRSIANDLLDRMPEGAAVDLVESYAAPIPAYVVARLLGLPDADVEQFRAWSDEVVAGQYTRGNATGSGGFAASHPDFARYLDAVIAQRRTRPSGDFLSRVVTVEHDGMRFTPVQARTLVMHLIVAGNETTTHLITNLLERAIADPVLYSRLRADAALVPNAIEESLRLDPPVLMRALTCVQPSERGDVTLPAGARVVVSIAAANRDPTVFADPDVFRIDRDQRRHLAFGAGAHFCPGAGLARLEAVAAVQTFVERVAVASIAADWRRRKVQIFWANGPKTLTVRVGQFAASDPTCA
jgi:cytochrome P450